MSDADRSLCTATSALLGASTVVGGWSLALSAVSILVLATAPRPLGIAMGASFGAVTAFGILERYLAVRIAVDAALFQALGSDSLASVAHMDAALVQLGAVRDAQPARPVVDRVHGARKLALRHGAVALTQTVLMVVALVCR